MRNLAHIIILGVKQAGSFKSSDVLPRIEEVLSINEVQNVESFLDWVVSHNKRFGHGNIYEVMDEYAKDQHRLRSQADP